MLKSVMEVVLEYLSLNVSNVLFLNNYLTAQMTVKMNILHVKHFDLMTHEALLEIKLTNSL